MKCPNCNKEMRNKSYIENVFYGFGDEPDYIPTRLIEDYHCVDCMIKFHDGVWTIPKSIMATEKQLKAGKIIESNTGISMPHQLKNYCGNIFMII